MYMEVLSMYVYAVLIPKYAVSLAFSELVHCISESVPNVTEMMIQYDRDCTQKNFFCA